MLATLENVPLPSSSIARPVLVPQGPPVASNNPYRTQGTAMQIDDQDNAYSNGEFSFAFKQQCPAPAPTVQSDQDLTDGHSNLPQYGSNVLHCV